MIASKRVPYPIIGLEVLDRIRLWRCVQQVDTNLLVIDQHRVRHQALMNHGRFIKLCQR